MACKMKAFNMPLYRITVTIAFDRDMFWARTGVVIPPGKGGVVCNWDNAQGVPGVGIYFDPKYFDADLITHESIHAAWRVLDLVGVEVSNNNHEALSYLAGYIAKISASMFDARWANE